MNDNKLTQMEQRYIDEKVATLKTPEIILRYTFGAVAVLFSSVLSPSAESSNLPFKDYLGNTRKRVLYTKYKNAVIRKQNGNMKKSDLSTLSKLNSSPFALEEKNDTNEDDKIREIYDEYMRTHQDKEQK